MVDEVEQAAVRPLQVLEDEDDDATLGDALEEDAPRREERLAVGPLAFCALQAEELKQAGLEPASLGIIGDSGLECRRDLRAGRGGRIRFDDFGTAADHLGQCPEADPFAVRR